MDRSWREAQHTKGAHNDRSALNMSPKTYARIGGVLYLVIIAPGLFGEAFTRDRLIV